MRESGMKFDMKSKAKNIWGCVKLIDFGFYFEKFLINYNNEYLVQRTMV